LPIPVAAAPVEGRKVLFDYTFKLTPR